MPVAADGMRKPQKKILQLSKEKHSASSPLLVGPWEGRKELSLNKQELYTCLSWPLHAHAMSMSTADVVGTVLLHPNKPYPHWLTPQPELQQEPGQMQVMKCISERPLDPWHTTTSLPPPVLHSGAHFQDNFCHTASKSRQLQKSFSHPCPPISPSLDPNRHSMSQGHILHRTPSQSPPHGHLSSVAPWRQRAACHIGCCTPPPQAGSKPAPAGQLQLQRKVQQGGQAPSRAGLAPPALAWWYR